MNTNRKEDISVGVSATVGSGQAGSQDDRGNDQVYKRANNFCQPG